MGRQPISGRDGSDRKEFALLSALVLALATNAVLAAPQEAPRVRVRVIDSTPSVRIRGVDLGLFSTMSPKGFRVSADPVSEWDVKCVGPKRVEASLKKPYRYGLKPWGFAGALRLESPSGFLTIGERSFREKIVIHPVRRGTRWECEVVNHVDIEKYLDGLVNSEFSSKWSAHAIDAQVVAARTYAYYQMQQARKRGAHYDVEATVKDQVYDGAHKEDFRSSMSATRTRGMILTRTGSSNPIKAYYHSTCGGTTELPENVWGSKDQAFRRRVVCHYCSPSPSFMWEAKLSSKQIARVLLEQSRNPTPEEKKWIAQWPAQWRENLARAELKSVRVADQTQAGRAKTLILNWTLPAPAQVRKNALLSEAVAADEIPSSMSAPRALAMDTPISAALFRIWADPVTFKSTAFQVFPSGGGTFIARGRGYGHGVGLCQWGAKGMAEDKKSFATILKHYYPDAVTRRAW